MRKSFAWSNSINQLSHGDHTPRLPCPTRIYDGTLTTQCTNASSLPYVYIADHHYDILFNNWQVNNWQVPIIQICSPWAATMLPCQQVCSLLLGALTSKWPSKKAKHSQTSPHKAQEIHLSISLVLFHCPGLTVCVNRKKIMCFYTFPTSWTVKTLCFRV